MASCMLILLIKGCIPELTPDFVYVESFHAKGVEIIYLYDQRGVYRDCLEGFCRLGWFVNGKVIE